MKMSKVPWQEWENEREFKKLFWIKFKFSKTKSAKIIEDGGAGAGVGANAVAVTRVDLFPTLRYLVVQT